MLVLGGGKIGGIIVELLHSSGDYGVAMADASPQMLTHAPAGVDTHEVDVRDTTALTALAQGATCVVSALPFFLDRKSVV